MTAALQAAANRLKAMPCWGAQDGLLSAPELVALMEAVIASGARRVLELGHYYGLSTAAIAHALRQGEGPWTLDSVDSHEWCLHVPDPAPFVQFEQNQREHFPQVSAFWMRTQDWADWDYPFVFYDADHGEEQRRVLDLVAASPACRVIVFDDADYAVPAECVRLLEARGWVNEAPAPKRGPDDKRDPKTMTLAILRRAA